jgi:large subunit ribosomal protein L21
MYAVVKTGGKQFRVSADDVIKVEKLVGDAGDIVTLEEVLMVGGNGSTEIGAPKVDGASVSAEILEQGRDKKITVFKKRRRQNYRRKKGHRQPMTVLKVREILTGGAKPSVKAAAKPAAKKEAPKAEAKEAPKADIVDDVALIGGVGPKLKEKLETVGITSLAPLAEMSDETKAKLEEIGCAGRAESDEWQEQAKELLAGKPPRAKVDQAAAKKDD